MAQALAATKALFYSSSIDWRRLCWETDNKKERCKRLQAPHSNSLLLHSKRDQDRIIQQGLAYMNIKTNQSMNIGINTGKFQFNIYIRPLAIYFTVSDNEKGINEAINEIKKQTRTYYYRSHW